MCGGMCEPRWGKRRDDDDNEVGDVLYFSHDCECDSPQECECWFGLVRPEGGRWRWRYRFSLDIGFTGTAAEEAGAREIVDALWNVHELVDDRIELDGGQIEVRT